MFPWRNALPEGRWCGPPNVEDCTPQPTTGGWRHASRWSSLEREDLDQPEAPPHSGPSPSVHSTGSDVLPRKTVSRRATAAHCERPLEVLACQRPQPSETGHPRMHQLLQK
uniref:(northern house mosquito) hypothetical protein n=1 Tax=Culex pipiens TaxID=7175 RepID=A0A8D8FRW1_CULPI